MKLLKKITPNQWNDITSYMDDEIRERIHAEWKVF